MRARQLLVALGALLALVLPGTAPAHAQSADLRVTAVSNPPSTAAPATVFSVTDTTTNAGAATTGVTTVTRYRLSADALITSADRLLTGTRSVPILAAGGASTATANVAIPAATPPGVYFLAACADDTARVVESSETNNCRVAAAPIRIGRPDLVVTASSEPPPAAFTGTTVAVNDTTSNSGDAAARASSTRYRLSRDRTITSTDTLLIGSRSVPALAPGASSSGDLSVTIPTTLAEGTYYLAACADVGTTVTERDETNNCRSSTTTVQVRKPADLVINAISNPPAAVVTGGSFTVTDTTDNNGPGAAAASITRYRLSIDTAVTGTDPLLTGTRAIPSLGPNQLSTGTATLAVPTSVASGTYYLAACADDPAVVTESNETNNCRRSTTRVIVTAPPAIGEITPTSGTAGTLVTITGANFGATQGTSRVTFNGVPATPSSWTATRIVAPVPAGASTGAVVVTVAGVDTNGATFTVLADLRVVAISNPPASAVVGGTFSVTDTTSSGGGPVGATVTRYRLSLDATVTRSDVLLVGMRAVGRLGSGASSTGAIAVGIPATLTPGTYSLGACADDTGLVTEADEANNCRTAATTITVRAAPAIASLSVTTGAVGTSVTITGSAFGAMQDGSLLSFNGTTAAPSTWTETAITSVVPAGATTGPVTVTVGGVKSNARPFTVVGSPDLRVIRLSSPRASLTPGRTFVVTETTSNVGTAPAAASTTRYRLSGDAVVDAADVLLAESRSVGPLAAGTSSSATVTLSIPATIAPGRYHLVACADAADAVAESSETNNCRLAGTTAQLASARDRGIAWLITRQAGDGSWNRRSGAGIVTTATAVEALQRAGLRGYPYARGVAWLGNASAPGVDGLARQITALAGAGTSVASHVQRLLSWRNTDKAWGAYARYDRSAPDTALALRAIRASLTPLDTVELTAAICTGILSGQQPDGSWSYPTDRGAAGDFVAGGSVIPTAHNVLELDATARATGWTEVACTTGPRSLSTPIDGALTWLLTAKRRADGGFGDGAVSTVHATALVHRMLAAVRPSEPALAGALDYLLAAQAPNGSWHDDPLQTAIALQTLPAAPAEDADRDGVPDTIEVLFGTSVASDDSRWLAHGANTESSTADALGRSQLAIVSVVPSSIPADAVARARVTVRLLQDAAPVSGHPVNVTTSAGSFAGGGITTTVVTGADGRASLDVVAPASKVAVTATVTASYLGSLSTSAPVTFTGVAVPDVRYLAGTAGRGTVALDWAPPSLPDARVVVLRRAGTAPAGVPIDGVDYGVGSTVEDAAVVFSGTASGFTDTAVTNGVEYFYRAYVQHGAGLLYSAGTALRLQPSAGAPGQPLWTYALAGGVMRAEPTVDASDGVYQSTGNRIVAVREVDGRQRWAPIDAAADGVASVTPAVVSGVGRTLLVVTHRAGRVQAVDATTGGSVWGPIALVGVDGIEGAASVQSWEASDSAFRSRHGPTATDLVFVVTRNTAGTTNNRVVAMRLRDGVTQWEFNGSGAHAMDGALAGAVVDHARNRLYVVTRAGAVGSQPSLWVLDTLSGALAGSLPLGHVETRPLLARDGASLYVANTAGRLEAIDLAASAPVRRWATPVQLGLPLTGPVAEDMVTGGLVYFATTDGSVWALQDPGGALPPNPAAPSWKTTVPGPSAPLVLDRSLLVGSSDGKLRELRLGDGSQAGEITVGGGVHAVGTPVSADPSTVYVGTAGEHLHRYQVPLP